LVPDAGLEMAALGSAIHVKTAAQFAREFRASRASGGLPRISEIARFKKNESQSSSALLPGG
jgi:hypothetical protein